jgi:hypothetical protein
MFGKNNQTAARTVNLVKETGPAVDLDKVRSAGHVDLAKRAETAGVALDKRNLAGIRGEAVLVLDHSGSMHNDYANGKVQQLVERVLGFALQIDGDGTIPVIPFDSGVWATVNVTVNDYRDVVNKRIWQQHKMASTNLADALGVVREMAKTTDSPLYVAVVTDGNPDNKRATTEVVCDLARYPAFIKFLAIREVPYLQELDDLDDSKRLLDNVDAKFFTDLNSVTDEQFAEAMADEWDTWMAAAQKAGVLR